MSQENNSPNVLAHSARGLRRSLRRLVGTTVFELVRGIEHAIDRRLRSHILSLIGQPRHDQAGRQATEFWRVGDRQQVLAFELAQLIHGLLTLMPS